MSAGDPQSGSADRRRPIDVFARVQNPALGSYLMWHMGAAFAGRAKNSPRLELQFLVLPLLWHGSTLSKLSSTLATSGLAHFVAKLRENEDELLAVHTRALKLRQQTLDSIAMGTAAGILDLQYETATVRSVEISNPPMLPGRLFPMQKAANKLGIWFSDLSVTQIVSMMRVSL